ncbi:MAG: DUF2244 domain-containing protein [Wenzhouxiangellaceae bacterium]|nr:DUF2244 domain-containing protein [Wenzhouxiangellaceae bacterium]
MVRIHRNEDSGAVDIEVLSNLSLTLDRLAGVFLVISASTLTIALWPTLMGYWPIMVIAVLHLAVVGWCFRLAWRGNWKRQDIRIDARRVRVRSRTADRKSTVHLPTCWTRVQKMIEADEPSIHLVHGAHRIEIGAFVPAAERLEAMDALERAIAPHTAWSGPKLTEQASSG